ncbi:MAG: type II secretion system protein [Candidatus Edwardsbacteria bacterium]|nr:type II secretion system protein [Candidatus Edwardsbacteria bacterium]
MKNIVNKNFKRQGGMSMVELLVAITILAIGLLSIAGLVPMSMRTITNMRLKTRGVEYMQQQMEILKRTGFAGLPTSAGVGTVFTSAVINPSQDNQYRLWWRVTADVNGEIYIRQVTVLTTWGPSFRDTLHIESFFSR